MSNHEDADGGGEEQVGREALARLEDLVGALLTELETLRNRARYAESRMKTMERELDRFVDGDVAPGDLVDRLTDLESRNQDLTERLDEGRAGVERLLARIRFLEEQAS